MASAMASFNGILKYGNATYNSATTICEVQSANFSLSREVMDATNRCVAGKKRWIAGELDGEITLDILINKDNSAESDFDLLLEMMLESTPITHVWFVDSEKDGIYCAEMIVTNLTQSQNMGEVIKGTVTLKPNEDLELVLNGAVSSGSI